MALSLGAQGSSYLQPNEWLVGLSYRYLNSFRDFDGSEDIPVPSPKPLYANTHVHTFDVNVSYAVSQRLSFTLELPFQYGTRATYYEHDGETLHTMHAGGVGDLRLTANYWLLDPGRHP